MLKPVSNTNIHIPDHTIIEKIGSGGMSTVYLARQISLQRKVAIKVLRKLAVEDEDLAERFVNEAKTIASLDHPHIISIYEAKRLPSGLTYFTMPYLNHGNFGDIICTNADHLIDLLSQICDGLAYAHDRGVIHRDLKPENILFDQFGQLKIADFGIALSKDTRRQTKDEQILGSPHYMSPEQIQSSDISYLSDIYSLGCIIYEKLTGDHLYDGNNDFAVLLAHINKTPTELPVALENWQPILNKCLAKNPKGRYQSALEVKIDLRNIKNPDTVPIGQSMKTRWPEWLNPYYVLTSMILLISLILTMASWLKQNTTSDLRSLVTQSTEKDMVAVTQSDQQPTPQNSSSALATTGHAITPVSEVLVNNDTNEFGISEEEVVILDNDSRLQNEDNPSVEMMLSQGHELLIKYHLTKPVGNSAIDRFKAVLNIEPENEAAKEGLNQIARNYFLLIRSKLDTPDLDQAKVFAQSMIEFMNQENIDKSLFSRSYNILMADTVIAVDGAIKKRRTSPRATKLLALMNTLTEQSSDIQALQKKYNTIPKPGQVVANDHGVNMVFIANNQANDFMVAQNEITVAQYRSFAGEQASSDKCEHLGSKPFFKRYSWTKPPFKQTAEHPVICITATEAQAYAQWLSSKTGHTYRLPTASEWHILNQYANQVPCEQSNLAGQETTNENKFSAKAYHCTDTYAFTAPVQSYAGIKNVHDINGNVAEWILNCNQAHNCQQFAIAGSSWLSGTDSSLTQIEPVSKETRVSHLGFRLVRTFE